MFEFLSIRIAGQLDFDIFIRLQLCAGVAQLAEQLFCKQQVVGSSPSAGFYPRVRLWLSMQVVVEWANCGLRGGFPGFNRYFPGFCLAIEF